ncbi:hypothetical protein ACR77D_19355 [Bacteroides kribbi]|uniref:hypothetical protein n=1 Tax=Bacteroides kribbi TaxID=1912894 RepID=UPI003DA2E948
MPLVQSHELFFDTNYAHALDLVVALGGIPSAFSFSSQVIIPVIINPLNSK